MTRLTCKLEIVKVDEKSTQTLVDVIQALAFRSDHRWDGVGDSFGFWVDCDGDVVFDYYYKGSQYDIYEKTTSCFESGEDIVWDNYEDDIKAVASSFPQFEFYFHIISDGVSMSDKIIYAHGSDYSCKDNVVLTPKQMWECTTDSEIDYTDKTNKQTSMTELLSK